MPRKPKVDENRYCEFCGYYRVNMKHPCCTSPEQAEYYRQLAEIAALKLGSAQ